MRNVGIIQIGYDEQGPEILWLVLQSPCGPGVCDYQGQRRHPHGGAPAIYRQLEQDMTYKLLLEIQAKNRKTVTMPGTCKFSAVAFVTGCPNKPIADDQCMSVLQNRGFPQFVIALN
jgi:hypothetical protein